MPGGGSQPASNDAEPCCSGRDTRAQQADDLRRALLRVQAGAVRGALIGFTLRGGLHLAGHVLSALGSSRGRQKRAVNGAAAIKDTLRYTGFLAALAACYIGVEEGISRIFGKERSSKWRALVAGICAGHTLLLTGSKDRHYSLAVYVLLRGITLLIRTGNRPAAPAWLRALLGPTRMEHGDTLLMCACCSQIIYAFIMYPQTLPPSYVRFIRKQGAKELYIYQGIQELARRTAAGKPLYPLTSLQGTPYAHCDGRVPCRFFHPGQTCSQHAMSIFPHNYERALRVYLPVYLLPMLLVHRQRLLKEPLPILNKAALGVARSSLFLSLCICAAFGGACAGHRILGHTGPSVLALSTWVGGLALLVEKKSRRMELALYVLSRSLESFVRCLLEWGWLRPRAFPARMDVALFAAGCGAIMHCYSDGNGRFRDCFRSKYRNLLDFVFGGEGFQDGAISHIPSNEELLHAVSLRVTRSFRSLSAANLTSLGGAGGSSGALSSRGSNGGGSGGRAFAREESRLSRQQRGEAPMAASAAAGDSATGQTGEAAGAAVQGGMLQQDQGGHAGVNEQEVQQPAQAQMSDEHQQQEQQQELPSLSQPLDHHHHQQQQQQINRLGSGRPPLAPSPGKLQRRRSLSLDDASAMTLAP